MLNCKVQLQQNNLDVEQIKDANKKKQVYSFKSY